MLANMRRLTPAVLFLQRFVDATWPATVVDTAGAGSLCECERAKISRERSATDEGLRDSRWQLEMGV